MAVRRRTSFVTVPSTGTTATLDPVDRDALRERFMARFDAAIDAGAPEVLDGLLDALHVGTGQACPGCGGTTTATATECHNCGTSLTDDTPEGETVEGEETDEADLAADTMTCPECGATIPADSTTCPECGAELAAETVALAAEEPVADPNADDTSPEIDPANPGGFNAVMCVEGVRTADDRMIGENAATWRTPPLCLMMQDTSGHGSMAGPAVLVGRIDTITRDGFAILCSGQFLANDDNGTRAARLVKSGGMTSVSIDGGDAEWEFIVEEVDEDGWPIKGLDLMTAVTILGLTMVPMPALEDAKIEYALAASGSTSAEEPVIRYTDVAFEYVAPEALVAAGTPDDGPVVVEVETPTADSLVASGGIKFPIAMFANPKFTERTPITVTDDGHVFGHLAVWGQCHTSFDRSCVLAPRSKTGYASYLTGYVKTDADTNQPVGTITMGGGHANDRLSVRAAQAHYDTTSMAVAYVNCGEDDHGIWLSGALKPGITDEQITELTAASLSGDWRNIGGNLELIASLAVNSPGFPVARVINGEPYALVAAGYGRTRPTMSILAQRIDLVAQTYDERIAALEATIEEIRSTPERAQRRDELAARFANR